MAKKRKNSRRANGEGSIVQRKDGRWCGVVTLGYKPDGKINRKSVYGHSQAEVRENERVKTSTCNWSTSIFNNSFGWRNNEKLVANFQKTNGIISHI